MANTTNTTTKKDETKELKAKLKEQQEKFDALEKQIEQLTALLAAQTAVAPQPVIASNDDIGADYEVLVISLVPNKLNLINRNGEVIHTFEGMYEEQYVDYESLKDCVNSHRDMARNGRYYIADEKVVSKLRLKHVYENILSPEQFKDIIDNNVNTAVELYKMAPIRQQKVIVDIIKEKRIKGVDMDKNMLYSLSEISGTDLVNVEDVMNINIK